MTPEQIQQARELAREVLATDQIYVSQRGQDLARAVLALTEQQPEPASRVSPVLGEYSRGLHDALPNARRQDLKPFIPLLPGTADDGLDETRGYLALDWLIRTYTPAWLDLAGLSEEARSLRELRRIVDLVAAQQAGPVVRAAQSKARAAWDAAGVAAWDAAGAVARDAAGGAAWDAAWDAAGDAAWGAAGVAAWDAAGDAAGDAAWDAAGAAAWDAAGVAAWDAAGDATGDAAWDAAGAAAWGAAWDAARDAAREVLKPTVDQLQQSAISLFGEMIRPAATSPSEEGAR